MAKRKRPSTNTWIFVGLGALAIGWLALSGKDEPAPSPAPGPAPGPTPSTKPGTASSTKPDPDPTISPTPGLLVDPDPSPAPGPSPSPTPDPAPAPAPEFYAGWCSSLPNTSLAELDPETVRVALVSLGHIPLVWLMLALNVTGFSTQLPTAARILRSADPAIPSFDTETQAALRRLLPDPGRALGVDKSGDILNAWRAFQMRDSTRDVPCPVVVSGELSDRLNLFAEMMRTSM